MGIVNNATLAALRDEILAMEARPAFQAMSVIAQQAILHGLVAHFLANTSIGGSDD